MRTERRGDEVAATVVDSGPAFDPTVPRSAERPTRLGDVEPGGWGLALVQGFADETHYRRQDDRDHLELVFASPAGNAAGEGS